MTNLPELQQKILAEYRDRFMYHCSGCTDDRSEGTHQFESLEHFEESETKSFLSSALTQVAQAQHQKDTEEFVEELEEIYSYLPIHEKENTDIIIWDIGSRIKKLIQRLKTMITQFNPTQAAIVGEIYKALKKLGAKSDLLASVGSWGDTLSDDDVLHFLQQWNKQVDTHSPNTHE